MSGLADIVKVTITSDSVGVQQAGFGVPLLLSSRATFPERVRFYKSLAEVAVDFPSPAAEYKAAAAVFSASRKPEKMAIGRRALKPTLKYEIDVVNPVNNLKYKVRVGANTAEYTADGSATALEIITNLTTLINAFSGDTTVASNDGSDTLILTSTQGEFDAVEIFDYVNLAVRMTHVNEGIETDLAAIALENNSWYFLLGIGLSKAEILAAAAWVEANSKIFVVATSDTINVSLATGADLAPSPMKALKNANYARTAAIFHPAPDAFADCAWVGKCAPLNPGSETWKFKTLAGVAVTTLTATHETNVNDKDGNHYQTVAGIGMTAEGVVAVGEFIDVIRFRDWLAARLAETIFAHLAAADKIPFTDDGIAVIEGDVRSVLAEGIAAGGLASNPAPTVTVPKASAVSTANKNLRKLPDVKFTATLAGAIHAVEISGVISV
jgi:hypothetical protein